MSCFDYTFCLLKGKINLAFDICTSKQIFRHTTADNINVKFLHIFATNYSICEKNFEIYWLSATLLHYVSCAKFN